MRKAKFELVSDFEQINATIISMQAITVVYSNLVRPSLGMQSVLKNAHMVKAQSKWTQSS